MLEKLHRPADEADLRAAAKEFPPLERPEVAALVAQPVIAAAAKPPRHVHALRWMCWTLMLVSVGLFAGADVYANWLEARGRGQAIDPVTATGWVRLGIKTTWYALPLVALTLLWLVWHFIVGAFHPGLPM